MKKLLIGLIALVVVIVAALFVVPPMIPADIYKDQIATQVRDATGRELAIKGDMSFTLLPNVAIEAGDVTFANAKGAGTPNMVALKRLVIKLKVFPLISGQVEVDSFVLVDPVINLEVDKRGTPNWLFAPAKAAKAAKKPAAAQPADNPAAAPADGGAGIAVTDIRLGDVRISNGTITYADARSGRKETISKVNLTLTLESFTSPFDAKGALDWNGKTLKLSAHASSPADLLAGKAVKARLGIESEMVTLGFDGSVVNAKRFQADGPVKLDVPSIRKLADWAGQPIEMAGTGLGPLKIDGQLALRGAGLSFSNATIALDEIRAAGGFTYTGAKVPHIKARLDIETLNLNPYLGGPEDKPAAAAKPSAGAKPGATPAPARAQQWSTEPIDASALNSLHADLSLSMKALIYQKIKIGKSALKVTLRGGRLTLDLTELALYQGAGKGRIVVDASKPVLGIEESFELSGIQAEPFLRDAADIDRLQGRANATIKVRGSGRSQLDIVKSLNGNGAITFLNGSIKGLNLASMVRSISLDALTKGVNPAQKTDFSKLSGTFTIKRGILENRDLQMLSPLLRVTGAGTSNLPARTVNYRIEPKAVASLKGQGGTASKRGLVVPIMITGPWHNLSYQPDLTAMLQIGPEGIVGAVKSLTEGVKSGGAAGLGGILKALTGQGGTTTEAAPVEALPAQQQPAPPPPVIDLKDPVGTLKKLLPGFN